MIKPEIFYRADLLFKAAAELLLQLCEKAIAAHGKFVIALSGGNTPRPLYELLAKETYSKKIDWNKVFVFWSDERCVPPSDPDNNSYMASLALLNNIPIPKENIFPVPVNFEPSKAAYSYEEMIRTFFKGKVPRFDLILLGIGEDGHTASLFPGTGIVNEQEALVKNVYLESKKMHRVSFTFPLINNAANILFLVTGKDKSAIMHKIFEQKQAGPLLPAQLVQPLNGKLYWFVEKTALSPFK